MIILLSPSKTLAMDAPHPYGKPTQPPFLQRSQELIHILRGYSEDDLKKLMGISDKLAALNVQRYHDFTTPFTAENASPAIYAFKGDVYDGLDAQTLSETEIAFAQEHVRMLSGLYGVLRPLDLMQAYRLEMGIRLANPKGKDLYAFWGETLRQQIDAQEQVVINLASNEYAKAAQLKKMKQPVCTPVFKEKKGNQLKVIGLMAKRARGRMTRWIVQNRITQPEMLQQFDVDGYRFDAHLSDAHQFTFVRG
jgi:cytoplasmic iron level regulating protein YaaA (DUF328/UPF0246 family)